MQSLSSLLAASFETLDPIAIQCRCGIESIAEAEATCDAAVRLLGVPAAWKLGATAAAVREALSLDEAFFGPIPEWRVFSDGAILSGVAAGLRGVECEYGFRLGRDAEPADSDLEESDFLSLFSSVHPAIEIPGSRFPALGCYGGLGLVADFGAAGALVVGPGSPVLDPSSLTYAPVRLSIDGRQATVGSAANLDGGPLNPVRSFLRTAFARGYAPRAGQVIVTGSCTGYVIAPPGARVCASFDALISDVCLGLD